MIATKKRVGRPRLKTATKTTVTKSSKALTPEFRASIALEAMKGEKKMSQIARENGLTPFQVFQWKKQLDKNAPEIFARKPGRPSKNEGSTGPAAGPTAEEIMNRVQEILKKEYNL